MSECSRYLITGAAGSVGSRLVMKLLSRGHIVCAFDNSENGLFKLKSQLEKTSWGDNARYFLGDIRDSSRLLRAMSSVQYVIHCAALKHVEMSEINSMEAIATNINGTKNVVEACIDCRVSRAVFTSSDKAVNPTSLMGATKLIGERLFTSANNLAGSAETNFSSVRFGNVLDTSGSVMEIFRNCIKQSQPFPITDLEMTRFFLTMNEAVELCLFALERALGGEIFVRTMGAGSILKLAQAMAGRSRVDYEVIGAKVGEKLWEELITKVESSRTVKIDEYFTVVPEVAMFSDKTRRRELTELYEGRDTLAQELTSKEDDLSWEKLREIISNNKI